LADAGSSKVSGDLVGDESYFHGPVRGRVWNWEAFQESYGAEVSALTINDKTHCQLTVKPGKSVGAPCQLLLVPETGYVTISNRHTHVTQGTASQIEQYRVAENVVFISSGGMPLGGAATHVEETCKSGGIFWIYLTSASPPWQLRSPAVAHDELERREMMPFDATQYAIELGFDGVGRPCRKSSRGAKIVPELYANCCGAGGGNGCSQRSESGVLLRRSRLGLRELNKISCGSRVQRGGLFEEGPDCPAI